MEPIRILHILHRLNRGGIESRTMDLYRALDRTKFQYDFYVYSGESGVFDEEIRSMGGRVYLSQGHHSKYNIPNFKEFYKFLSEHKEYRIVYAYNQWAGFYLREAKKSGVPIRIANAETSVQRISLKNIIKNIAKINVNRYATHRFAVSQKAAYYLFGKKLVDAGQVKIWPNAINTQRFKFSESERNSIREELGLGSSFTIIHVGNLLYVKNHPFLLRVFSEIKKIHSDSRLLLIGAGDITNLLSLANELGIQEAVSYLGAREDVPNLLLAGDVFIFPSFYEGFPGAVLEAECSGLPCIISDSITNEVVLTDSVKQLSLSLSPHQWAVESLKFKGLERTDRVEIIRNAGFDVQDLVHKMEMFYTQCYENEGIK